MERAKALTAVACSPTLILERFWVAIENSYFNANEEVLVQIQAALRGRSLSRTLKHCFHLFPHLLLGSQHLTKGHLGGAREEILLGSNPSRTQVRLLKLVEHSLFDCSPYPKTLGGVEHRYFMELSVVGSNPILPAYREVAQSGRAIIKSLYSFVPPNLLTYENKPRQNQHY